MILAELREIVQKVRSKNAGPFWLTIDIFCGDSAVYEQVRDGLDAGRIAALFRADPANMKRFDMPDLNVVKFSLPRPQIQGDIADRDMHGASWAVLVGGLQVESSL